jgi:hypothetical protein
VGRSGSTGDPSTLTRLTRLTLPSAAGKRPGGLAALRYLITTKAWNTIPRVAKKREKLSDQIRRSVDASGLSRYRICKTLGLAEATMSRFMNRQGGLSMQKIDALADLLGLDIANSKRKGR